MDIPISFSDIEERKTREADGCIPIFHMEIKEDVAESQKTGKRVFKEVPYVKIISPGNDKEIPDFRVNQSHKDRWPAQWAAFQKGEEAPVDGFPLTEWNSATRIEAKLLYSEGIKTVEALVATPDANLQNIGHGLVGLKHRAEAFLKSQDGEIAFQKLSSENEELKTQIETMSEQIKGLEEKIKELGESKPKFLKKK